jgi:hypothetical protein
MVTLRNTKGAPLTYTEMDSNLLEFEQANTNLQNNIATGLASKASVNHTQLAVTITDLPAVAALQDFSQTTGTRPTSAIQGLDATLTTINTSLANLTANKVDKVNSQLSGATLVTSPQPTAAANEVVSAAWVRARIAEIGIAGGAPVNTALPAVTVSGGGSLIVGAVLNGSNGTWTGNATITYAYQWFRTGVAIGGETTINHTIVTADLGTTLTLRVAASNGVLSNVYAFSAGTIVPPASLVFTANPSFTGTLTVGSTVTTDGGTTSPATTPTVQWYRGGVAIAGATGLNYVLVTADGGQDLFVRASSTLSGVTVTADSITQRINAVNPYTEGSSFSSTNSIKALALASDQSALYIAENIVVSGGGSITAPTPVGGNVTATITSGSMTVSTSGFTNGNTVLLISIMDYWADVPITWPAGFAELFRDGYFTSDGTRLAVAWKTEPTMPGSYAISWDSVGNPVANASLTAYAVSGANASAIDFYTHVLGTTFRAYPSITMPNAADTQLSGTTGFNNDLLIYIGTADPDQFVDANGIVSSTPPTSPAFTERIDSVVEKWCPIELATFVQASAGATGNITGATATFNLGSAGYIAALIAIRGVAGGGGLEVSNGIIAKSLRSGGTSWAAKSTVYSGDGVAASADEGWYTGLACTSNAGTVLIGAASNGYAGPGYGLAYDLVNNEQIQRWVGTFDAPAGSAWPDAIACSSDGLTRVVLIRGAVNQVWTFDGTEAGVVIPISSLTGSPISLTPTAFGNRITIDAAGLKMAVVTSTTLALYSRSAKQAAWSVAGSITPRASGLASVAMSRDATTLAVSTSAGVDVYQGTWPTFSFSAALLPTGGGYSSLGLGLALDQSGGMIIASEYTATGATGTTRSEKTSVIRTWKRAP